MGPWWPQDHTQTITLLQSSERGELALQTEMEIQFKHLKITARMPLENQLPRIQRGKKIGQILFKQNYIQKKNRKCCS